MSLTRISEEGVEKRRIEIARLKNEIREFEALSAEKESPLWRRLSPLIKQSIELNRGKIDEILGGPSQDPGADYASIKLLFGAVRAYQNILDSVEVDKTVEAKRARVTRLLEEIKHAQDEQGL